VTVRDALQHLTDHLQTAGVETPRVDAEWLLAHVVKLPRTKLGLNAQRALTEAEEGLLQSLAARRATREPLQHVLGTAAFCDLELTVNRHVLVPRPETELLAEQATQFLSTLNSPPPLSTILDLGTGSGCLAIQLAHAFPRNRVVAVDVSPEALAVARENAVHAGVAERVEFLHGDLFGPLPAGRKFTLIVSNPPYIPSDEIATLSPEVREHDPRLALDGGADGLDFYRRIAAEARAWLAPGGKLMLEFGDGQDGALREIFSDDKWIVDAVLPDYSGRARMFIARAA
jgi:release factor glutamine methyltransferase